MHEGRQRDGSHPRNRERPVEVPHAELAPETLRALAEEFVTRDGTDYGASEKTLDEKVAGLMRQLATGKAKIFYESESETINIVAMQQESGVPPRRQKI
jgi:uncharacterized protein YheU (UPF0270 family)